MRTLPRVALYRVALLAAIAVVFAAVGFGAVHIAQDTTVSRQQEQRPIPATLLPLYGLRPTMPHFIQGQPLHYVPIRPGKNARMPQ
jgi:hypothetical protein